MDQQTLQQNVQVNETSSLLQLANRQVLQERMIKEAAIKEAVRRALLS